MTRRSDGISICIPNWNHRDFLGRSVGSALAAGRDLARRGVGCQVIVVDDFSRDGSQRALYALSLADPSEMIDIVLTPENAGLAAARNRGLVEARYRWVCLLDADNELIPENLFHFWCAIRDTKAAFLYGNLLVVQDGKVNGLLSNDFVTERLYSENYIDAFAIVDVEKIESLGGYYGKHAPAHEDWELLLHLIAEGQDVVFVPMVLGIYYREHLSMITTHNHEHARTKRIFNQRGSGFPVGFEPGKIYHPKVGWLMEGTPG